MIRLIQRRLIIPRGDTGSFSIPVLKNNTDNIAVFTIFDEITKTRMFQKMIPSEGDVINIAFTHSDTVNLKPGRYVWDIKYYSNPEFIDDELVNGNEIDSYYAGFSLPVCEIRETADNYLVSPDGPNAKLSPEQLEIVTGAIHSLNEAIRKTQENVEHYPEIRDEVWYIWDAESGDYVSTGVRANGIVGNGIESAVLNDDYTLTLNFTDGTSFTSPSIRGEKGNGIDDIVLNNDFTLTIRYTDGESYTTPVIRGPVGPTPQFSIGAVQDGAVAAASITGTAENPVLNLTLPNANVPTKVSELENDANYAVDANYVHTDNNYTTMEKEKLSSIAVGAQVNVKSDWNATSGDAQILNKPTKVSDFTNDTGYLTEHQDISGKADKSEIPTKVSQLQNDSGYLTSFTETDPTVPAWAKEPNKPAYTAAEVGAPTIQQMNTAIGEAIGQINSFDITVVQALPTQSISTHTIYLIPKTGETNDVYDEYIYINNAWEMVGNTQIDLSNYALKSELPTKVSELSNDSGYLISYTEIDPTVPQWAKASTKPSYTAVEVGALPSDTHIPSTTAELTNDAGFITVDEVPAVPVQDVQVNGTSVLDAQGVANVPVATSSVYGTVKVGAGLFVQGAGTSAEGQLSVYKAGESEIKDGAQGYKPIVPQRQHISTFYGLAKAAGDSTQSQSSNSVGEYTPEAKAAIQQMLGVSDLIATAENSLVASRAYAIGDVFTANGKLYKAISAIAANDTIVLQNSGETISGANAVETKVGEEFVKFTDYATASTAGIVKVNGSYGIVQNGGVNGPLQINYATAAQCKNRTGSTAYQPLTVYTENAAVFYGLAYAAGDTTMASSSNAVGTYTDEAKAAIKNMLGITQTLTVTVLTPGNVTVTGQTVTVRADDAAGEVYATAAYEGQPVSFSLPTGFQYYVSVSDTLNHHFNPTTARGVIKDTNVAVTLQYSDLSTIKTAPDIKAALNAGMDLTDLVGEQITCTKSGETLTWDVVDYDDTNKRITLLLHDAFGTAKMVFEPVQALMWCENGLAAGSYTFKWNSTQVYFTLTTAIPAGGQLRANNSSFWTYESQSATATLETGTVSTTEINGATDLGKTGDGLLNHHDRVSYGSNNFAESALYWWLNSDAAANTQRVPVTKFSRAYSYAQPGFLNGLDASFVAVLDNTTWLCACNNVYECPESLGGYTKGKGQTYTVTSKIGLASEMEISGSYGGNQDRSTIYDLYNGATATDRIKYRGTSAQVWWLRSPYWGGAYNERYVGSSGIAGNYYASYLYFVVPACRISVDHSSGN